MNYEEFVCQVQAGMKEKMGDEVRVERRRITKNNGVELEGIIIEEENQKISPMIYLEDYYHIYEQGAAVSDILKNILKIYEKSRVVKPLDVDFYTNYEKAEAHVVCKLINYERNQEKLHEIPHVCCLDLALVFYYVLKNEEIGNGTILIHNSHLKIWQITEKQLYETARRNTPQLFPYDFREMGEILEENLEETGPFREQEEELPMYVLSNNRRHFGAVNIIYDSILSEIGRKLKDDFYVLPSSIHECIIIPAKVQTSREELENMVWEINRTQVLPEEVLSDHVYFYERSCHRLSF